MQQSPDQYPVTFIFGVTGDLSRSALREQVEQAASTVMAESAAMIAELPSLEADGAIERIVVA